LTGREHGHVAEIELGVGVFHFDKAACNATVLSDESLPLSLRHAILPRQYRSCPVPI
jgi:hypothetical protein